MKRTFLYILVLLFVGAGTSLLFIGNRVLASTTVVVVSGHVSGGGAGATDYTASADCMGAWYMNVDNDSETDRSGEGGTLTECGGDTNIPRTTDVPGGYAGYSRDFSSSEALYHADNNSTDITELTDGGAGLTIAGWIKVSEAVLGRYDIMAGKWDSNNGDRQYWLGIKGSGSDQFKVVGLASADGSAYTEEGGDTSTLNENTWYHIALTMDGTDMTVYVNGSADSTAASFTTDLYAGDAAFTVGSRWNESWCEGWNKMEIDEVIVMDVALTGTQLTEIYNNGIDGDSGAND
jgi:hypothetical protein